MAKILGAAAHLLRDLEGLDDDLGWPDASKPTAATPSNVQMIAITQLEKSPFQARTLFLDDELASMADSFLERQENGEVVGIIQPLTARCHPTEPKRYQLASGEKRWRAAEIAGLASVPVIVKAYSDRDMTVVGLLENVKRSGLAPVDLAKAAKQLKETFGYSNVEVAKLLNLGHSRSAYSMMVKILMLPEAIQTLINENPALFSAKHGRVLLEHQIPVAQMEGIANQSIDLGWSARALDRYCAGLKHPKAASAPALKVLNVSQQHVVDRLSTFVAQPIQYKHAGGKHVLSLVCEDDQLQAVLSQFELLMKK